MLLNFFIEILLDFYLFYSMCLSVLSTCMYATCMPGVLGGHVKAMGPVELESQIVANHHVDAGN